jgi:hypothetical protein
VRARLAPVQRFAAVAIANLSLSKRLFNALLAPIDVKQTT